MTETLPLAGYHILVVEDQSLIAMEMQQCLEGAGASVAGPANRLERALKMASEEKLDASMLDVDLNGVQCWEVADVLAARSIPFAFTTGVEASVAMPDRFKDRPMLSKPYIEEKVVALALRLVTSS